MKSWWPFQRRVERRESAYSDAIVELIRARAAGVSTADATALGALEFCAGLWSRAFASATVSPDNFRTRALTPWMLSNAARALIRSGESIWDISVLMALSGCVRLHIGTFPAKRTRKRGATLYSFPGLRLPKLSTVHGRG